MLEPTSQMPSTVETPPEMRPETPSHNQSSNESIDGLPKQLNKGQRLKSLTSPILTPQDIAQEIIERSDRIRPPKPPEGGDVLFSMKLTHRLAQKVVKHDTFLETPIIPSPPPAKIAKIEPPENKAILDTHELLRILQDGAETHYVEKPKPKAQRLPRGPKKHDFKIDPELEKKLALQQLMDFSSRKKIKPKTSAPENNNNNVSPGTSENTPKKKEIKKSENRELKLLLQDEGAINMLYSIEKGDDETKPRVLPSKRRMKKALLKKAQEVKEAILGESSLHSGGGKHLRLRASDPNKVRKISTESTESEAPVKQETFTFTSPAEASKIIRRHSSSSSYSSRSNSPRRASVDVDRPELSLDVRDPYGHPLGLESSRGQTNSNPPFLHSPQPERGPAISDSDKACEKSNGLKERLKTEFASKVKASLSKIPSFQSTNSYSVSSPCSSVVNSPPKCTVTNSDSDINKNDVNSNLSPPLKCGFSPHKPIWKQVEEDWSTNEDGSDVDCDNSKLGSPTDSVETSCRLPSVKHSFPRIENPDKLEFVHQLEGCRTYKELLLRQIGYLVQINIAPTSTKLAQSFNSKVLNELSSIFEELGSKKSCRTVLLTCSGDVFSHGVDLQSLVNPTLDLRRSVACETATALKQFIFKLCMFNKPIIAGVGGAAVGLGVALLAYCDIVIASQSSSFYTPYPKLGYLPEAGATIALPRIIGHRAANALLLECKRLSPSEAEKCGLVTRVVHQTDFQKEILNTAISMSELSAQSLESTKAVLVHQLRSRLPTVLDTEMSMLQQHWVSEECQSRMQSMAHQLLS